MAKSTFGDDFENFSLAFIGASEEAVRATVIETWSGTIYATPVREGRLRASWVATGKKPSTKIITTKDKNGSVTVNKMIASVIGQKDWSIFNFTNNAPQSVPVEFGLYPNPVKFGTWVKGKGYEKMSEGGYSKQAPQGMLRINMARAKANLEAEFKKRAPK